jgi:hypothetical protein
MFYKKGIDITNDRQMFEFLKGHFEYPTLSSWNRLYSIANNVKLNHLGLSGDWCTALAFLENGEYDNLGFMIHDWMRKHIGYEVYFNGRSGGYLVLKDVEHNSHILPESILDNDTYEEYKEWCHENYGTVKANRDELVYFTKLVQDFDKLCDELRDYCDELSNLKFEVIEMQKTVDEFNDYYGEDLDSLGFKPLCCDENGKVDINEIRELNCLVAAFMSTAKRPTISSGYALKITDEGIAAYEARF